MVRSLSTRKEEETDFRSLKLRAEEMRLEGDEALTITIVILIEAADSALTHMVQIIGRETGLAPWTSTRPMEVMGFSFSSLSITTMALA